MNDDSVDITFVSDYAYALADGGRDPKIDDLTTERDWKKLGDHLEGYPQLPSIGDYLNIPDLSDTETRRLMCKTPRVASMLMCWESARVLSHIQFRYNQAMDIDNIETVTERYEPARKGLSRLFRIFWDEPLDWGKSQSVLQWMTNNGATLLHIGEPNHIFDIAQNLDDLIEIWDLDLKVRKHQRVLNKFRNRCSVILEYERYIRSIPEFGQISSG